MQPEKKLSPFLMALRHLHFFLAFFVLGTEAAVFTLENRCRDTIWPGIQPGSGSPLLMNGGFQLRSGETINIDAPTGWSGRIWARSDCTFDASGKGNCITGDCGGLLECAGRGGVPPATLAEFTVNSSPQRLDFYDISLVDGFNMPISIIPSGGSSGSSCKIVGCISDLNVQCPVGLQVRNNGEVVGCKSACMAFNQPEYCCTGTYANPDTCKPTSYSQFFKASCPTAYSYAFDDRSSLVTCSGANYLISFC